MMACSLRRRRFAPGEAQRSGRICGSLNLPPDPDGSSTQPLSSRPSERVSGPRLITPLRIHMIGKTSAGVTSIDYMLAVLDDAFQDFSWTIWHEGVRAFDDGDPGSMREMEMVRLEAIQTWVQDAEAQELIRAASIRQLVQYVHLTRARVYSEFQLVENFQWVADREGLREEFRRLLSQRNFAGIRDVYCGCQGHNLNARKLLAALSNGDIEVMVNDL